jgi:hypothetical protein
MVGGGIGGERGGEGSKRILCGDITYSSINASCPLRDMRL